MSILKKIKHKIKFAIEQKRFENKEISDIKIESSHDKMNYLWIVYDSCRYDTLVKAKTPVIDKFTKVYSAWTPGTYTYPAHMSFFAGMLPVVYEQVPYLNRFQKQLIMMRGAGRIPEDAVGAYTKVLPETNKDIIHGLVKDGYYTVGAASTTWFSKKSLTSGFNDFKYEKHLPCQEQCNFILKNLSKNKPEKPFFAFMNLIETHSPYMHYGEDRAEYSIKARGDMKFPPESNEEIMGNRGAKLHAAQVKAAEHLDNMLDDLLPKLPKNTLVLIMGDHGECFGEDGFWGHGIYHEKVMNVPMVCFSLNGEDVLKN